MNYNEKFFKQTIKVMGEDIEVVTLGDDSDLFISSNISEDMTKVSAQLAYWGSVLAHAKKEQVLVNAFYRRYVAQERSKIVENSSSKVSEWKVKDRVESSDAFIKHKQAIAESEKNVELCDKMVRAFDKKANLLQSKGASLRAELNAQGTRVLNNTGWNLSGDGSEKDDDGIPQEFKQPPSTEDKVKRMEKIMRRKSKKGKK